VPVFKPDMPALVVALAEFMQATVQPKLAGKEAYEGRIAANLLSILKRELQQGESSRAAERLQLQQLLAHEGKADELNDELCRKIRSAEVDYSNSELIGFLRSSVLARLAIDNPGYSAYKKACSEPNSQT